MNLVEFREYVLQAEEHMMKNPLSSRKIAFLSTEDPGVIAEAKTISSLLELSTDKGWEWYWSDIPRMQHFPRILDFPLRTRLTLPNRIFFNFFIYTLCRLQWGSRDSTGAFRKPDGHDHKVAIAAYYGSGV